jgi:hypothetical protein
MPPVGLHGSRSVNQRHHAAGDIFEPSRTHQTRNGNSRPV